jgi:tRNA-dihydrouridine synthase A
VLRDFLPYLEEQLNLGVPLNHISRHILGLFQQVPGAKQFRRYISENAHLKGAGIEVLEQAMQKLTLAQEQAQSYRAAQQ